MIYANIAFGIIAAVLMMLVLRGTVPHMLPKKDGRSIRERWSNMSPGDLMRLGTGIYHIKGLLRIGAWDVVFLLATWRRPDYVALGNIFFCALAILGSLSVLVAIYRNIPEEGRGRYNILTAPWYPNPPPLRFRQSN